MIDFRVLRYFLTIARLGNITKAANSLYVTQPTVSRQIQELEDYLGYKLFIRSSHSVTLTEEGVLLRKRAEEILSLVAKTEAEFENLHNNLDISGDIYIGGGETAAISIIGEVIADLQSKYKNIRFHLYSGNAEDVSDRLDKGLLDFGIFLLPADIAKYDYITLPSYDTWGVLMRKDCDLAKKDFITREDLIDLPLIMSRQAMDAKENNNFVRWFGEDFNKLNVVATFNLLFNAAMLAKSKVGYVVSLDNIVYAGEDSDVCFRPLKPKLEAGLTLVWKKYQVFSQASTLFLENLKQHLEKKQS